MDEAQDVGVPVSALGHALRTPSNVLGGYARLLAAGDLGPLAPSARAAVGEMSVAARNLDRVIALLEPPSAPPSPAAPHEPLTPVFRRAVADAGWQVADDAGFRLAGVAWPGWPRLFYALAMAARAAGERVRCSGEADGLGLVVDPAASGSGDEVLALAMARIHADAAGFALRQGDGAWRIAQPDLIRGEGVLTLSI